MEFKYLPSQAFGIVGDKDINQFFIYGPRVDIGGGGGGRGGGDWRTLQ